MEEKDLLDEPINKNGDTIEDILKEDHPSHERMKEGISGFFDNIMKMNGVDPSEYEDPRITELIKKFEKV